MSDDRHELTGRFVVATGANVPVRIADDLALTPGAPRHAELSSVVAAASNAAKMIRTGGGFAGFADPLVLGEQRARLPGPKAPVHELDRFLDALAHAVQPGEDHHDAPPVLLGRAGEAVARFLGVAGLEPVGALHAAEVAELGFEDGRMKEAMPYHNEFSDSVFMGTAIASVATLFSGNAWLLAGGALYLAGGFGVTALFNVPNAESCAWKVASFRSSAASRS